MQTIDYANTSFVTRKTFLLGLLDNVIGVLFLGLFAISAIGFLALIK